MAIAHTEAEQLNRLNQQTAIDYVLLPSIAFANQHAAQLRAAQEHAAGISLGLFKEAELINRLNHPAVTDYVLQASIAFGNQHAVQLRAVQEHAVGMNAGLKYENIYSDENQIDRFSTINDVFRAEKESQRHLAMYSSAAIDEARGFAELAQTYNLHASLDPFRTSVESFTNKLLHLQTLDAIRSPAYLDAYAGLDDF